MLSKTSEQFQVLPEDVRGVLPPENAAAFFPMEVIEELNAFAFDVSGSKAKIAAVDPASEALHAFVKERFKGGAVFYRAAKSDIRFVLENSKRDFGKEIEELTKPHHGTNGNIIKVIDRIIWNAVESKASDIHIEPLRHETVVRFRVDGLLHTVAHIPKDIHPAVVARLKILGNLKIDEYRRPQDGRIEPEHLSEISLRISTIPTLYGEKVALRVLDESQKSFSIETLGFTADQKNILLANSEKPFGMIVVSGPTGSGKTTSLYALLNLMRKDGTNISTLEDPIEYSIPGVNQIQVNPRFDFTFASGLRALLRQDPDIIMVGEVRDSETAVMAANAALTGHLVLTTIHTNDAPSVFPRLLEMNVEDFVVGSIVNLVIAQRLVRRVCDACAEKKPLDEAMIKKIKERKDVIAAFEREGISMKDIERTPYRSGKGCDACFKTGYIGRVGIFELLSLNKKMHDLILEHASAERLKAAAQEDGFRDLLADGLEKVRAGSTTFEEVLRTTRSA